MTAANAIINWTSSFGGQRSVGCRGDGSNVATLQHWGQRCLTQLSATATQGNSAELRVGQIKELRQRCSVVGSTITASSTRHQPTNRSSPSVVHKKRSAAVKGSGGSHASSETLVRPSAPPAARLLLLERQALLDSESMSDSLAGPPSSQWPRHHSSVPPSSQWPRHHSSIPPSSRWPEGGPQQRPVRTAILADLPQDEDPTASGRGPAKRPQELGNPLGREATLARALSALPTGADYGTVLRGEELSGPAITRLLSCMKSQGGASRSLDVFNWLDAEGYPTRDCYVLSRLMSMLGSTRALHLFERLTGAGLQPDLACFNAAINCAGKARRWQLVEELQMQMLAADVEGDVVTYTTLISASQACGRWDAAQQHWAAMQAAGIEPTVISLTTMMSASNKAGHWQYALQLFDQLASDVGSSEQRRNSDIIPDVVLFNAAITACASGAAWERAWAIFSDMRLRQVQPNARSYNALLSACERAGQPDRVLEVFRNMKRRAAGHWGYIDPNLVTYNTLLSACAKAGRYDEAIGVYQELQQRGLEPDSYTLTALLTASERVGNWRQALDVFDDFSARHIPVISCNYNSLIYTLATGGEWQKALDVLQRMRDDTNVELDAISYSSSIIACARGGCCKEGLQLLEEMQSAGYQPSSYTYATLIDMCETAGDWSRVVELVQSMQADDIDPVLSHRVMYAPLLQTLVPDPLLSALRATVATGRAARRWIDRT